MPESEIRLRWQIVKLKELRAKDVEELSQLRTDVEHLVCAVSQLTVENRQLRGALLSQPSSAVRALPALPFDEPPAEAQHAELSCQVYVFRLRLSRHEAPHQGHRMEPRWFAR